jgi:hypothetical protein
MLTSRRGAVAALIVCSSLIAVAPAAAVPITVTQSVTVNQVLPFGTFTSVSFTPTGWNVNPFPFTQASQITQIRIWFDSTDPDYLDNSGPGGGTTWTSVYVVNDSFANVAIASVDHAAPNIFLAAAQGSFFTTVRSLILDGQITFALGAYESFPDHVNYLTLNGPSTLRLEVSGDAPALVPEPTPLLLLGTGLLMMLCLPRRSGSILSHLVMTTQGDTWIAGTSSGWGWLGFRSSAR